MASNCRCIPFYQGSASEPPASVLDGFAGSEFQFSFLGLGYKLQVKSRYDYVPLSWIPERGQQLPEESIHVKTVTKAPVSNQASPALPGFPDLIAS